MDTQEQRTFMMTEEQYQKILILADKAGKNINDYIYRQIELLLQAEEVE